MRTNDVIPRSPLVIMCRWQQADGRPTGAHAAFKPYGVDAATLRLVVAEGRVSSRTRPTLAYLVLAHHMPGLVCRKRRPASISPSNKTLPRCDAAPQPVSRPRISRSHC